MKKSLFLVVLIMSILMVGCKTIHEALPTYERTTLTQQDVKNLEMTEDSLSQAKYLAVSNIQTVGNQNLVNNIYVESDVKAVLLDIASQTGVNIIPDNTVEGSVTLTLKDVPLERAFDMIFYPGGYRYRYIKEGNYYIVGKSLPENSSFDALTTTKVIKTNRGADKVLSQLSPFFQTFVKADGQTITITASPDVINRIERDISLVDKSKRQIEISAKFMMIEWEKGVNLGIQWSDINLNALGIANLLKGGGLSGSLTASLGLVLKANGYDTKITSVAEPRITVEEGENAELNITEEHLFLILSGGGAAYNYFTTKEVAVGVKLKVQPFVTRDGQIRLNVNPEVSDIVGQTEFKQANGPTQMLPIIARRSTETVMKIQNGETVAIGGLMTKSSSNKKSGIPFFRKIPVVGSVFGNSNKWKKETELVVFITAKVIE